MASTYVRSTRPIGKHNVSRKQIPVIDTTPFITKALVNLLAFILDGRLESAFQNIRTYQKIKQTHKSTKIIAIRKIEEMIPRIQERIKYQSLFFIMNFCPVQSRANFDEINWHKDRNQQQPVDPKSQILKGIVYCPLKRPKRDSKDLSIKKHYVLGEQCMNYFSKSLNLIFSKSIIKGMVAIKSHCSIKNKPFRSAVSILLNKINQKLMIGFCRIKFQSNRLYLKPRTDEVQKYKSLSLLKSQRNIQQQRKDIIKQGIERQKSYRNQIIIAKQRELRSQVIQIEQFYDYESDKLRSQIMQKQLYIQNIFPANLHDTSAEAFNYFDILKSIYLDMTDNDKTAIPKRNFVKKYQLQDYDQTNELLMLENVRLWQHLNALQQSRGNPQFSDIKTEQALRIRQKQILEQNNNMKKLIKFYVRQEYGNNLNKQRRLINNLKRQLQDIETKLQQNRIEDVKVIFS